MQIPQLQHHHRGGPHQLVGAHEPQVPVSWSLRRVSLLLSLHLPVRAPYGRNGRVSDIRQCLRILSPKPLSDFVVERQ